MKNVCIDGKSFIKIELDNGTPRRFIFAAYYRVWETKYFLYSRAYRINENECIPIGKGIL